MKRMKGGAMVLREAVRPMERGQVTIPSAFRKSLNITPNTWLWMTYDGGDRITIEKIPEPEEADKAKKLQQFMKKMENYKGPKLWTEEDDKNLDEGRKASIKKAKERAKS